MMTYIKAGARHNRTDQQAIQDGHDALVRAGATCGATKAWTLPQAIKAIGGGKLEGFLARYSDPNDLDAAGDFFDSTTRINVRDGQELPLLWHHGLDRWIGRAPIGSGVVKFVPAGVWFRAQLLLRSEYEKFMYKLAEMRKAGFSSGADPASVVREPIPGRAKAFHIKAWTPIECSLTATPADFGNTVSIKSLMAGSDPRLKRIRQDLAWLERERVLDIERDLDQLERTIKLESELKGLLQ